MRVLQAFQAIPGHVNPNLALARQFREHGHEVAMYTGERARSKVVDLGFKHYPFQHEMDRVLTRVIFPEPGELTASNLADENPSLRDRKRIEGVLRQWFLATIGYQLEDLNGIAEEFSPDVLVCDFTLVAPILILRHQWGTPVVGFCVIPSCPIPGPEAPPWGAGLVRPRNGREQARQWLRRKLTNLYLRGFRREVTRIRYRYGLPGLTGSLAEEYGRMPLFMVAGAPSLDYERKDLPRSVKYVGLCEQDGLSAQSSPAWLTELTRDRPLVYVTEGTVHFMEPVVLRAAVKGLDREAMHVVITTGADRQLQDLAPGTRSGNIRVEEFVPHGPLFRRCDLLVTTGSAGTIIKALVAGVPIVIVPIGWEHAENAQRIVEAGVGLRIDPSQCDGARLRTAVREVLGNPTYRIRAQAVGQEILDQGGSERAVTLIEDVVRQTHVSSP